MFKQFKEFAFKGNLVDMAVGFILGAGFSAVVKSFVTNCVMPVLGLLMGGIKFDNLKLVLANAGEENEVAIKYGSFLDEFIAFTLLAFVVFIVVKKFIAAFEKKEEEKPAEPAAPSKQEVLLAEILEQLKK
ncbi:MAG: large conductance mechanosensitive channel protein MscL [Akkermansiaceae bacterium]